MITVRVPSPASGAYTTRYRSVSPEGLFEPPGRPSPRDLRVHQHRPVAGPGQPARHGREVVRPPDGRRRAAEAAADRGQVGGRERDGAERMPGRPEMVDLRAVGFVV